jgi:Flp pilus assembly protein TadG
MWRRFGSDAKRGLGAENGGVAVEFAIIIPVLLLLMLGGMDLGHRYYIQYLASNASREGARYAAKYRLTATDPSSTEVSEYVKLPSGLNYNSFNLDTLTVSTSYDGTFPNKIATVTVTAIKHWWLLGSFNLCGWVPLTNPQTITATTAMNVEH